MLLHDVDVALHPNDSCYSPLLHVNDLSADVEVVMAEA
jgi:hypothetical protein